MNTWEDNYALVHWGIKGQKWGIRRYQNEDGTLTQLGKEHYAIGKGPRAYGNSKFAKKYEGEMKKLKKYDEHSDRVKQMEKAISYDKDAKTLKRAGNAALAVALPTAGVAALAKNHDSIFNTLANTNNEAAKRSDFIRKNADLADYSGTAKNIFKQAGRFYDVAIPLTAEAATRLPSATQATGATILATVAGVTAATAYGASAYARIQSNLAKRRITDKGHAKAVAKRDAQYNKIRNMVKDTPYMALFKDQIEAYKKEHPNTELSDKQIMKNLM